MKYTEKMQQKTKIFIFCFSNFERLTKKHFIMKKTLVFLTFIFGVCIILFSCSRNSTEIIENIRTDEQSTHRVASTQELIIHPLFMYGVQSYEVGEDGKLDFTTYRNFQVNRDEGNISDFVFYLDESGALYLDNDYVIEGQGSILTITTPEGTMVIDSEFDFQKLDMKTALLLTVFSDLNATNESKDTFSNYTDRFSSGGGGCSWMNTYYLSGWGYTPSSAWSDYHFNASVSSLVGGCSPIGNPHLSTHVINLAIFEITFYQVDRAYCCK